MFPNKNLSNFGNVLHGNLSSDRAAEFIFRAFRGKHFGNFAAKSQP